MNPLYSGALLYICGIALSKAKQVSFMTKAMVLKLLSCLCYFCQVSLFSTKIQRIMKFVKRYWQGLEPSVSKVSGDGAYHTKECWDFFSFSRDRGNIYTYDDFAKDLVMINLKRKTIIL